MIKEWIGEYKPQNTDQAKAALREIMQEVALAGLQRSGFFEKAAFYGGTALRIFHGLDRFSEDLDFSLLHADPDFSFEPHFESIITEFGAIGMKVSIKEKKKTNQTNIDSAFLKSETVWKELILDSIIPQAGIGTAVNIKIKLEVDREPPSGFETEEKLLLRPFSFYVKCFTLPNLFAGKLHALLFRKWGNRVKGRDWYDFEWYVKKGIPLNLQHFLLRAQDSGDWKEATITKSQVDQLINDRIDAVSMEAIKEDIRRFIPDDSVLDIWSPHYFHRLVDKLRFE
ncbi:nucleotidyl transferase AbiEii/AbiGii toxin family protein [Pseudobacter ginsenosidimutans]|uniref:Nucleotidyltransferase AbiEii toxin of type IV toxin-antitoxin system n=1 Tax=Pseudobacter ginsenosidimutans TaxID=661488 RepID=A0A4Q7MST5_9BACT|nr:nucleotidyl transferase AbiEii/AbiGii toxin family protein [Pseudobacter ginsenosidimutans]QEC41550.1 nucleotidyl transferase AbiEii/AbiGii toxin family protein [Pseudobacter ginsenosidimutans]RZS71667.1 nucleotidyltransferase AbiEii toxin of type IV toxin-antitoxin system [Pseudobacter ginsenosidimutans]